MNHSNAFLQPFQASQPSNLLWQSATSQMQHPLSVLQQQNQHMIARSDQSFTLAAPQTGGLFGGSLNESTFRAPLFDQQANAIGGFKSLP
jgi:hypothetical protein